MAQLRCHAYALQRSPHLVVGVLGQGVDVGTNLLTSMGRMRHAIVARRASTAPWGSYRPHKQHWLLDDDLYRLSHMLNAHGAQVLAIDEDLAGFPIVQA